MLKSIIIFFISGFLSLYLSYTYGSATSLSSEGLLAIIVSFILGLVSIVSFVIFIKMLDSYLMKGKLDTNISKLYRMIRLIFGLCFISFGIFIIYSLILDHKTMGLGGNLTVLFFGLYSMFYGVRIIYKHRNI
jgi:uncharacterized BrkB/YihY/UPF0761 family membrane protein